MEVLKLILAIFTANFFAGIITLFKVGQASNLPGRIAIKIKKDILSQFKFCKNLEIVLVTGTNGKSTTTGLLCSILKANGKKVITNNTGANLLTGIITTLCRNSSFVGDIKSDYLVLEVDEATLKHVTKSLNVHVIVVTNFFRDQLDRFGELDTTVKLIEEGIKNVEKAKVILNADDPRVAFLKVGENQEKIYFGLSYDSKEIETLDWMKDPEELAKCVKCGSDLILIKKHLAHLGDYHCSKCEIKRPELKYSFFDIKTDHKSTYFNLIDNGQKTNYFLPMIGIFNLYNAICAISVSKILTNPTQVQIQKAFQNYSTIFGRGEKINVDTSHRGLDTSHRGLVTSHRGVTTAWVYLIKNPIGTTEVIKTLSNIPNSRFLIAINDNFADGRDISWLWDARFELLANSTSEIFVSGKRAFDMALRLKYSNVRQDLIKVNRNLKHALRDAVRSLKEGEVLYILPTYTVLLEMQRQKLCGTNK